MTKRKPLTDAMGPIPDEWYEGFAAAVASVARLGEASVAKSVMVSNGVTVEKLKDNGVEAFDLDPIKRVMRKPRCYMTTKRTLGVPSIDPKARVVAFIPLDGYVKGHGYRVSLVVEGERFHRPTGTWPYHGDVGQSMPWFWGDDYEAAQAIAESYNRDQGIDPKEAALIVARSMVGLPRASGL